MVLKSRRHLYLRCLRGLKSAKSHVSTSQWHRPSSQQLTVAHYWPMNIIHLQLQGQATLQHLSTPNVNYSGRTAPLTSKVAFYIFIQQIYALNILNMVYTLRFFLFKVQFVS